MPKKKTNIASKYIWDAVSGHYINPETGRVISHNTIKKELEKVIKVSSKEMRKISTQFANGEISLGQWQVSMLQQVKLAHIANAAAGNGGWAQMNRGDWGFVGNRLKQQYKFLNNFARQIKTGEQPVNGKFLTRVDMYAAAARSTFEQMKRRYEMTENAMEQERRILGPADHCDDCIDAAKMGWVEIGTLPEIGDSVCKVNCQCKFEYRRKENGRWVVERANG